MKDKSKISAKRWIYLAGLLDGDGHISITAHPHEGNYINYDVVFGVTTTHRPTAKWLISVFGGKFCKTEDRRPNRKTRYFWYVSTAKHQVSLLENVKDYLKLKNKQAEIVLRFLNLGGRSFQDTKVRKRAFEEVSFLNDFYVPIVKTQKIAANKNMLTKADYQYLAGLIDAEGCISLYENKRSFDPKIQLANTDMRVFDFVLDLFGGSVSESKREHRILGNFNLPTQYLEKTLLATIPYLITKKEQAVLLLTWFRKRNILSDDETREYIKKFRILNHRGTAPTTNTANDFKESKIESDLHGDAQNDQPVMAETN